MADVGSEYRPRRDMGPVPDFYMPFEVAQAGTVPGMVEIFKPLTSLRIAPEFPVPGKDGRSGGR